MIGGIAMAAASRTGTRKQIVGSSEAGSTPQYNCSKIRMNGTGSTSTRLDSRESVSSGWIWGVRTPASTTRMRAYLVRVLGLPPDEGGRS